MTREFERRSLELTPVQWGALDRLAAHTESIAPTGPTAGQTSWRTLIKRIADGEVEITIRETAKAQLDYSPR